MEVINSKKEKFLVPGCIEQPVQFNEADVPVCRKIDCLFFSDCLTADGHPLVSIINRKKWIAIEDSGGFKQVTK